MNISNNLNKLHLLSTSQDLFHLIEATVLWVKTYMWTPLWGSEMLSTVAKLVCPFLFLINRISFFFTFLWVDIIWRAELFLVLGRWIMITFCQSVISFPFLVVASPPHHGNGTNPGQWNLKGILVRGFWERLSLKVKRH